MRRWLETYWLLILCIVMIAVVTVTTLTDPGISSSSQSIEWRTTGKTAANTRLYLAKDGTVMFTNGIAPRAIATNIKCDPPKEGEFGIWSHCKALPYTPSQESR
jgi:hypothetical protein